jgi:hypothetical protein
MPLPPLPHLKSLSMPIVEQQPHEAQILAALPTFTNLRELKLPAWLTPQRTDFCMH